MEPGWVWGVGPRGAAATLGRTWATSCHMLLLPAVSLPRCVWVTQGWVHTWGTEFVAQRALFLEVWG